jgi:hypothetical protein
MRDVWRQVDAVDVTGEGRFSGPGNRHPAHTLTACRTSSFGANVLCATPLGSDSGDSLSRSVRTSTKGACAVAAPSSSSATLVLSIPCIPFPGFLQPRMTSSPLGAFRRYARCTFLEV